MAAETRVRVNFSVGEIEIAGDTDRVSEWWELLSDDVAEFRKRFASRAVEVSQQVGGVGPPPRGARADMPSVPETFGEFLHQFPTTITDIERALIAGFFAQAGSENNSFTTSTVNELLLQHGVRLANTSSSIRRNVDARRVITLGSGQFRVSRVGIEHVGRLQQHAN